jgi:hypothetical protein
MCGHLQYAPGRLKCARSTCSAGSGCDGFKTDKADVLTWKIRARADLSARIWDAGNPW